MFGDGEKYKVKAVFENAGQLVPGNQVRVGGQSIGTINDIELDDRRPGRGHDGGRRGVGALHEGTTATIRATSLSGIANRYVSLNPGRTTATRSTTAG